MRAELNKWIMQEQKRGSESIDKEASEVTRYKKVRGPACLPACYPF